MQNFMRKQSLVQQNFQNRNSTSSVHVKTTMEHPNNLEMITAVATNVQRMIADGDVKSGLAAAACSAGDVEDSENFNPKSITPSVQFVHQFYRNIFETAQCSIDCTLVSLIYLERFLVSKGNAPTTLTSKNWRSITMISMLLASKVWDDLSMVNADFSVFLPYTLDQINSWERQFLSALGYNVHVGAGEYAKRYFEMSKANGGSGVADMAKAKKLDLMSKTMQSRIKDTEAETVARRAVSDQGVHEPAPRFVLD